MSFISLDKAELENIELSLQKEYLEANKTGAYSSSSILSCNTRKYHGLLVVRQPKLDTHSYLLLNSLDETIVLNNDCFQLGVHQYPGTLEPKGYQYLQHFSLEKIPTWEYKTGKAILKKELLLCEKDNRILLRYTLDKNSENIQLRLDPFVSFRKIHQLSKYNTYFNSWMTEEENGISYQMYAGFDPLFFQGSKKSSFTAQTDWFFNNQYHRELERGYDYMEDLFRLGYFEINLKAGESFVFSVGITPTDPDELQKDFNKEFNARKACNSLENYLEKAAAQFISETRNDAEITAGFHWFGRWGRDTFIALPGLTLSTNQPELAKRVMDTMLRDLKNGLLTNIGVGDVAEYNSADASLWFFWSLQEYTRHTQTQTTVWEEYGYKMKNILENYRKGTYYNIQMSDNGLLSAGQEGVALTWMDARVDGVPVTPRSGWAVDLNALWYNAICFSLESAKIAGDKGFVEQWQDLPGKIKNSFEQHFWNAEKGYLADCILGNEVDWSLRPNQVFAISLPYPIIEGEKAKSILAIVEKELLTPRGLRTLSPKDSRYQHFYMGSQKVRDHMYHQGIVWPWLLGHFAEALIKTFPEKGKKQVQKIYSDFENSITEYGLGSVAEIYNAEPPFAPVGTISQAWSVSELLRIKKMIN